MSPPANRLTVPRQRVLDLLKVQHKPVKPYDLLRLMDQAGTPAHPPTIYRALDYLVSSGLAHRVHSSGAYLACNHAAHGELAVLLVCNGCGVVEECDGGAVSAGLQHEAMTCGFTPDFRVVEVHGDCRDCRGLALA